MLKRIREGWQVFLHALMFLTRVPVRPEFRPERLQAASAWYPLVGILVGAFAALVFTAANWLWNPQLAIWLSLASTVWLTGSFHEDGFADFCDGFGGMNSKERTLEIMKDSRIGTYGSVGLILMLGARYLALAGQDPGQVPWLLVAGHGLGRWACVCLIRFGHYADSDLASKAKPLATGISGPGYLFATLTALVPLAFRPLEAIWVLVPLILLTAWMWSLVKRRIGGYTGDCLGALEQLAELVAYLVWFAIGKLA